MKFIICMHDKESLSMQPVCSAALDQLHWAALFVAVISLFALGTLLLKSSVGSLLSAAPTLA